MKTKLDWITTTPCRNLDNPFIHNAARDWLVNAIVCADGTELSVQASRGHYCQPRDNDGPWDTVEVGYPTANPGPDWLPYKDNASSEDSSDVYAFVPVGMVLDFINAHGGEKQGDAF